MEKSTFELLPYYKKGSARSTFRETLSFRAADKLFAATRNPSGLPSIVPSIMAFTI
jgi:hypothetical protein